MEDKKTEKVMMVRHVPAELHRQFRIACATGSIGVSDQMVEVMRAHVALHNTSILRSPAAITGQCRIGDGMST